MKYSYNWLKEISKVNKTPEEIANALMMHSFEVESVEKIGNISDNVVVGKILEIKKHPDADRLQLTKIDIGTKELEIVCGANNIKVGDKVPVALVGVVLPGNLEIKEAEIRGVKSFGMLCAEDELGLGIDHSGILILEKDAKIGAPIKEVLGLNDTIFEIKVLPDRGHDTLSHVGVAREVAVLNDKKIDPYYDKIKLPVKKTAKLKVEIKDKDLCPRYIGAIMENVKIQPSPAWIKNRLLSLGIKSINNIVDATNLVMLEFGQPLHAFDLRQITPEGKNQTNIIIRRAKDGEEIKLLDDTVKKLTSEDLMIANEEKVLALAGIMGGEASGINENTTSIVLESANFNPASIRKSRSRLNIKTEASDRYEKGIDPNLCEKAMARVIEIIKDFDASVDGIADNYPSVVKSWQVKLDLEYANKLLGEKIETKIAIKMLNLLGIKVTKSSGHWVTCVIPTIRIDLKTQEDLIEEVGRIYGYDKIKSQAPNVSIQAAKVNENREFEKLMKNILVANGFSEVYNYSVYSQKDASLAQIYGIKHLELENPMNPDQELFRASLVPGILKNVGENLKNFAELQIFEIGKVYSPNGEKFPEEKNMLVGALVLKKDKKAESFFELKGIVDNILEKLGVSSASYSSFECGASDVWHPVRCAQLKIEGNNESFGYLGEINPGVASNFNINKRVVIFEFDMEKLKEFSKIDREFTQIRKYPVSSRDISMIAKSEIIVDDIIKNIQKNGGDLVLNIELFDIFHFEEKNETSFAFRISFGSEDRTLRNEEVEKIIEKVIENLEKELKVKIRK